MMNCHFYLIFKASAQLCYTFLRAFWFFGPAEEGSELLGTRSLIWRAAFLANRVSSSSFPAFFALPSFVTTKVKTHFLFKGQMVSSVAMAIHEACWQGVFEECELFFFHAGRSASQCVPLFLFRDLEHFLLAHVLAAARLLKSLASCPRGRPRPLADAQVFA